MKSIKIIFNCLLLFVISIVSCDESTIELDPIGDTEAAFFQNEEQMTQAVYGIYAKLTWFYNRGSSGANTLQSITLLPSDDLTNQAGEATEIFFTLNGANGKLSRYFTLAYQLISRANIVLEKIEENGSFAYPAASVEDDHHRGEALFLRSLMYFNLWNIYGTAPLVTKRITSLDDAYPPNSTGTQLLDQAIVDLTEAATLLPDSWPSESLGRATKNSARALLGKCLVFRGTVSSSTTDFTTAITAFDAITGVSLVAFKDNFDAATENNAESLFEFQARSSTAYTSSWVAEGNDGFAVIGEINSFWGIFDGQGSDGGQNTYRATTSLMNAFEAGDPRVDDSFNPAVNPNDGNNVLKYVINNLLVNGGAGGQGLSQNNPRILRYADILLLKAEAIVRSGGSLATAIGLVNEVRTRVRGAGAIPTDVAVPATNTEAIELIFDERRLELAFEEGHRWFDLRRRHMAGEIDLTTWDFSSVHYIEFTLKNLYFPLPENEVLQSPNLHQNEGY